MMLMVLEFLSCILLCRCWIIIIVVIISIISIINISISISIKVDIILRVTHWLHVPRGPDEDVPAIFWDEQPLRELLQYARDGVKPTPGSF